MGLPKIPSDRNFGWSRESSELFERRMTEVGLYVGECVYVVINILVGCRSCRTKA